MCLVTVQRSIGRLYLPSIRIATFPFLIADTVFRSALDHGLGIAVPVPEPLDHGFGLGIGIAVPVPEPLDHGLGIAVLQPLTYTVHHGELQWVTYTFHHGEPQQLAHALFEPRVYPREWAQGQ